MNSNTVRIMIDIETMGVRPGCKILSIGAVKFFLTDVEWSCFTAGIKKDDRRFHEEAGVMDFWDRQNKSVRDSNFGGAYTYAQALTDLTAWIGDDHNAEIWCNGSAFDIPILEHAFDKLGFEVPWDFRNVMCLRTMLKQHSNIKMPKRILQSHIALNDAVYQAECATTLLRALY